MAYVTLNLKVPRCVTELIVSFLRNLKQETKKENWAKYWKRKTMNQIRKVLETRDEFGPIYIPIRKIVSDINDGLIWKMLQERQKFFYSVLIYIDDDWYSDKSLGCTR